MADLAGGYKRGHIERINLLKGNIRGLVLDAIVPKGDTSQAIFKSEYFPTMEWRAELPKRAGLFEITATLHRPLSS